MIYITNPRYCSCLVLIVLWYEVSLQDKILCVNGSIEWWMRSVFPWHKYGSEYWDTRWQFRLKLIQMIIHSNTLWSQASNIRTHNREERRRCRRSVATSRLIKLAANCQLGHQNLNCLTFYCDAKLRGRSLRTRSNKQIMLSEWNGSLISLWKTCVLLSCPCRVELPPQHFPFGSTIDVFPSRLPILPLKRVVHRRCGSAFRTTCFRYMRSRPSLLWTSQCK